MVINWWWSYYKTDKNPVLQGMSSQFLFHFQRFQNMNSTFGWFLESIACVILLLIFCLCSKCLLQIYTPKWMVHIKSTKMAADFAEFIFGPGDICLFGVPTTLVDWKSKVSMIPYSLCLSCLSLIGQNWRRGGQKYVAVASAEWHLLDLIKYLKEQLRVEIIHRHTSRSLNMTF